MSIKNIPMFEQGMLNPKALYNVSVSEFEEISDWQHKDGVTGAYRVKVAIEGVVEGTGEYANWMGNKELSVGFYIPEESASWYKFSAEQFSAFRKAVGVEEEEIVPENFIGKTCIIKVKISNAKWVTTDGVKQYVEAREEINRFYPESILDQE